MTSPVTATPQIDHTFTGTGVSDPVNLKDGVDYALSVLITSGTVSLQRSFDDGVSWSEIENYSASVEKILESKGRGILYRFECTVFTTGPITCRVQQ